MQATHHKIGNGWMVTLIRDGGKEAMLFMSPKGPIGLDAAESKKLRALLATCATRAEAIAKLAN